MARFLLVSFYFICSPFVFGQYIQRVDGTKTSIQSVEKKIKDLMKAARVTGVAISVFNYNKPVFSKTFGYANAEKKELLTSNSIMYAASLAKMVFAYITMQLVEEKKIDLDKPLVEYLDKPLVEYTFKEKNRGYEDLVNDNRYKKITARMCLTHTTGFPNWRWFEDDRKLKILFEPGSRYSYSGEGLYLLQFVIEKITGKDYETISRERVFIPLGMSNTSQVWQERFEKKITYGHNKKGKSLGVVRWKEPNAGGTMSTTLPDITKFYSAFISGLGITRKSFNQMTSTQIRINSKRQFGPLSMVDTDENDKIQLGYGFGTGVLKSPFGRAFFKEGHDDGWGHYFICFPEKQIAILIMTNSDNGESIFKELLSFVIADNYTPWQWEEYIPYNQNSIN